MDDTSTPRLPAFGPWVHRLAGASFLVLAGIVLILDVEGPWPLAFLVWNLAVTALVVVGGRAGVISSALGGFVGLAMIASLVGPSVLATVLCASGSLLLVSAAGRSLVSPDVDASRRLGRVATTGAGVFTLGQVRGIGTGDIFFGVVGNPLRQFFPHTPGGFLLVLSAPALCITCFAAWGWTSAHLTVTPLVWLLLSPVTDAFSYAGPIPGSGIGVPAHIVVLFLVGLLVISLTGLLEIRHELRASSTGFDHMIDPDYPGP